MAKPKLLLSVLVFFLLAAGAASAQTVSIVSGQGQVTCFICPNGFDDLVVKVVDANGAPMANASVAWTVTGIAAITDPNTGASGQTATTATDSTGQPGSGFLNWRHPARLAVPSRAPLQLPLALQAWCSMKRLLSSPT